MPLRPRLDNEIYFEIKNSKKKFKLPSKNVGSHVTDEYLDELFKGCSHSNIHIVTKSVKQLRKIKNLFAFQASFSPITKEIQSHFHKSFY